MTLWQFLLFAAGAIAGGAACWASLAHPSAGPPLRWLWAGLAGGVLAWLAFGTPPAVVSPTTAAAPAVGSWFRPPHHEASVQIQSQTVLSLSPEDRKRADRFLDTLDRLTAAVVAAGPAASAAFDRLLAELESGGMTPAEQQAVAAEINSEADGLNAVSRPQVAAP